MARDEPTGGGRRRRGWLTALGVLVALLVAFVALGGILQACAPDEPSRPAPADTSPTTASASPPSSPSPAASAPSRPVRDGEPEGELPDELPESIEPEPDESTEPPVDEPSDPADDAVFYENCDEVRAAGAAPLLAGEPGYRAELDRDGDGSACDPRG